MIHRLYRLPDRLRTAVSAVLLLGTAVAVGCTPAMQAVPGPAAEAAATRLATDLAAVRGQVAAPAGESVSPDLLRFARVYDRVRTYYVRDVDDQSLLEAAAQSIRSNYPVAVAASEPELVGAAIDGMLASLDPYSIYLTKRDFDSVRDQTRGSFTGIGLRVAKGEGFIKVVSPIDGTPAATAGLLPGDRITHADGQKIGDLPLRDAVERLRGPQGSRVLLSVERDGMPPFQVSVTREIIHVNPVRHEVRDDRFGYIRISTFTAQSTGELVRAVIAVRESLGGRLEGVVLDLRNNPGGLLDESVAIADAFLDEGVIVATRGRTQRREFVAAPGDILNGLPIVVLVNDGSASAAEIVAGALGDNGRALLVGTRTFGKGSVQTIIPVGSDDALKLTTAEYFTPSGRSVQGGLAPVIAIEDVKETERDEQLERAYEELARLAESARQARN